MSDILSPSDFKDILKNGWYRNRGTDEAYDKIKAHDEALRARIAELEAQLQNAGTGAMAAVYVRGQDGKTS